MQIAKIMTSSAKSSTSQLVFEIYLFMYSMFCFFNSCVFACFFFQHRLPFRFHVFFAFFFSHRLSFRHFFFFLKPVGAKPPQTFLEMYLARRSNLKLLVLLADSRREPLASDAGVLEYAEDRENRPYKILMVATKVKNRGGPYIVLFFLFSMCTYVTCCLFVLLALFGLEVVGNGIPRLSLVPSIPLHTGTRCACFALRLLFPFFSSCFFFSSSSVGFGKNKASFVLVLHSN